MIFRQWISAGFFYFSYFLSISYLDEDWQILQYISLSVCIFNMLCKVERYRYQKLTRATPVWCYATCLAVTTINDQQAETFLQHPPVLSRCSHWSWQCPGGILTDWLMSPHAPVLRWWRHLAVPSYKLTAVGSGLSLSTPQSSPDKFPSESGITRPAQSK